MNKYIVVISVSFLLFLSFFSNLLHATDIVKLQRQQMSLKKTLHNAEVIDRALQITVPEFGPYILDIVNIDMSAGRMLVATQVGEIVNTIVVPANDHWNEDLIAIKIPVRLGLLSYRILLINKNDLPKFEKINNLTDLNQYTAGLLTDWVTTRIYKANSLNHIVSGHFDGIFSMLNKHRFDYLPRGLYEIYDELEVRKSSLDNVVVEPTIALNIPTTTNVYVSPTEPRLAKRLETGLKELMVTGELKDILFKYYSDEIKRANIENRKIIKIDNPFHDNVNDKYFIF